MTLRHLNLFMEVCRQGSITLAAEELNMAQPAVSYAIKELESYYEVRLFERMNRRLYITEAGERLMRYADTILNQFDEAKDVLRDIHTFTRVRLGTNVSYGTHMLPELLSGFRKEYPDIPVFTMVQNSSQIEEQLLRNHLDFGIMDFPAEHTMFYSRLIGQDVMKAAYSPDEMLRRGDDSTRIVSRKLRDEKKKASVQELREEKEKLSVRDLEAVPFLVRESGSGSRSMLDQLFAKAGIRPQIAMESISSQCLIESALCGAGIVFLPGTMLEPYIESGKLTEIKIEEMSEKRQYYLVHHKSKFLTRSMKNFQKYVCRCSNLDGSDKENM